MTNLKRSLIIAALVSGLSAVCASAQPARADVEMWRLDCGEIHENDLNLYSDTFQYEGRQGTLTVSCYLIRNGSNYLLWDSGFPAAMIGRPTEQEGTRMSLRASIRDQLARINVRPEQVNFVGISHYHDDHTGQAQDFPGATLLIGPADWEVIRNRPTSAVRFQPWIAGGATMRPVPRDLDVFGDGSVVMLATPGHTPGHHALLVRLPRRGPVLLTGDLYHFTANYRSAGVPSFNTNRSDTLASFARFNGIADNLRATVVIQHEIDDIAKLPAFPESAR